MPCVFHIFLCCARDLASENFGKVMIAPFTHNLGPKISCSKFNFKQRLFSVSFVTFTVKVLLLNFLCKVYSTNMTSLREREEKREKETLTATNSKAAAGSALSKGRCSKNGHCPKADCRNALALFSTTRSGHSDQIEYVQIWSQNS